MSNATEITRPAEAGHYGKDIRSDLHVAIEPRASGGLEIGLESRVGSLLWRLDPQPDPARFSTL